MRGSIPKRFRKFSTSLNRMALVVGCMEDDQNFVRVFTAASAHKEEFEDRP
jgi:hypothetical protein